MENKEQLHVRALKTSALREQRKDREQQQIMKSTFADMLTETLI
jgi:hypothetical protein